MSEHKYVLGILGGMGTYATIHAFQQYAEIFPAEKEWERPRLIIDNNCTMPSRVRACLYDENVDQLVNEMTSSINQLIRAGVTNIILGCNTSHIFLPKVYERIPEAEKLVINILDECVYAVQKAEKTNVYLLAKEGTIKSGVYESKLSNVNIKCEYPSENDYQKLRLCIEAVKQNKYTEEVKDTFVDFFSNKDSVILGCTELPILFERFKQTILSQNENLTVYDPLFLAIQCAKEKYLQKMRG